MISYAKFGGATRRRFFVILKKQEGRVFKHPRSGARVNPALAGVSAERHWLGRGEKRPPRYLPNQ